VVMICGGDAGVFRDCTYWGADRPETVSMP
jgi:hypothetical protein